MVSLCCWFRLKTRLTSFVILNCFAEGRDKEPFLMQRVPTSYLALEKAICYITTMKKRAREEPVLRATEYK